MVRLAFSSDNHFDVNRVDAHEMMVQQAAYLVQQHVQWYLIAGDLFNDFQRSQQYVVDLQACLGDQTKVLWIAGNHDMVNGVSFDELEAGGFDGYLHNRFIDIPQTDWRIIGHNGWYDYQYAANLPGVTARDLAQWKYAYWIDRSIKQPLSDPERAQLMLTQVTAQLKQAQIAHKQVILMTHFVPRADFVPLGQGHHFWEMARALMGTPRLGALAEQYQVSHVLFGHLHLHPAPRDYNGTMYYDQAVGYGRKRLNEWRTDNFMAEWRLETFLLDLPEKLAEKFN